MPGEVWFRGQRRTDWRLVPSIARGTNVDRRLRAELALMKRFQQNALPFLNHVPHDEWDWLFLMQHYGAPTRLLDWSESPLVGLYFAVQLVGSRREERDGEIWVLWPRLLNQLANIEPEVGADIPFLGLDSSVQSYEPTNVASERSSRLNPVAALAKRQFPRLTAQLGVFTVTHRDQIPLDSGEW